MSKIVKQLSTFCTSLLIWQKICCYFLYLQVFPLYLQWPLYLFLYLCFFSFCEPIRLVYRNFKSIKEFDAFCLGVIIILRDLAAAETFISNCRYHDLLGLLVVQFVVASYPLYSRVHSSLSQSTWSYLQATYLNKLNITYLIKMQCLKKGSINVDLLLSYGHILFLDAKNTPQ